MLGEVIRLSKRLLCCDIVAGSFIPMMEIVPSTIVIGIAVGTIIYFSSYPPNLDLENLV